MNTIQKGVIALIRSALTQQAQPLPEGFSLAEAMPVIRHHHVTPLAFEGAQICGLPQDPILFQSYCKALQISTGQLRTLEGLFAAFDAAGIDYMPLKGCNMKFRYPRPELRQMGDADILIRLDQYEKIVPILESRGFARGEETDHELHWNTRTLELELHKRLMPSYNVDFHGYFGDGWSLARPVAGSRHAMTAEDEFVFVFTHFAKHYRDGGIGCSHVADLWVFLRRFPALDMARVEGKLEELHLLGFWRNMRRVLAVWFEDAPATEKTDFMTDYVFGSGSFGTDTSRVQSRAVRDTKHSLPGIGGRLVYLWQTAFPPLEVLRAKYRVLKKHPWLLPAVWLVRPFYKVFFEFRTLTRQRQNLQALSPERIQSRQDAMRYVDLDFYF